jgi:hypothetical protein
MTGGLAPLVTQTRVKIQVVDQETQTVEKDALLTKGAIEHRVDLVNDKHAYLQLPSQDPYALAQVRRTQPRWQYRSIVTNNSS